MEALITIPQKDFDAIRAHGRMLANACADDIFTDAPECARSVEHARRSGRLLERAIGRAEQAAK